MYSLSAFFILSSRAPPNTPAAAFITPPRTGDNDQPKEDIIKTLNHKKYMVEDNRSFIKPKQDLHEQAMQWVKAL